jgi:hypothetical protein
MTIHLHLAHVTVWLFAVCGGLVILGPVLVLITSRWLEIGALVLWEILWALALVILILAIGSLL